MYDVSKQFPDKLRELQRLWLVEAMKYNVMPLDDRFAERADPDVAGWPQLVNGSSHALFAGRERPSENRGDQHQE